MYPSYRSCDPYAACPRPCRANFGTLAEYEEAMVASVAPGDMVSMGGGGD